MMVQRARHENDDADDDDDCGVDGASRIQIFATVTFS